jgi:alkylhydroperoxidase/carboxymuconolactone decarboxylase family protein YurZ
MVTTDWRLTHGRKPDMPARPSTADPPSTVAEVRARLARIRDKRGYLLPHHGLLAVAEPVLLDAYDATYTALTLTPRALDLRHKEIVWLVILVSTGEAIATHHIDRLKRGGGTQADLEAAVALAAWADGASRFSFVDAHWAPHLDDYDAARAYRRGLEALLGAHPVEPAVAEMALAAAHQCHRRWDWLREHIRGAYAHGADERALAEALSLAMFPGGVPNFVDACDHWRQLIVEGEVAASPPYRAWAEMTGQGGYDEAVGVGA